MELRCAAVLITTLLSSVLAGPVIDSTQCATQCPESAKFNYNPGQTYFYTYESDIKTSVAGATEEHSSLHLRATAQFEVISPCEMSLTLSDVSLLDSNPAQFDDRQNVERIRDFKNALQQRPLRFAFLDGTIESVCPDSAEKTWVLNIKKGIVSALQNTMSSLSESTVTRETDVSGDCPVEYEILEGSWGTKKISKVKNLLACTDRHGYDSFFQATPYRVPSNIQSLPLMKTSHECTQEIDKNGIISSSSCQEKHTFRPFAKHHNGATTEVSYKLAFSKKASGIKARAGQVQTRVSLLFDHVKSDDQLLRDISEAQNTLESLCSSTQVDIRPDTPSLFAKLVRIMKQLDTPSLRSLHQKASASKCIKTKKFFYDAVPLLGSTASVALTRDLIQKGELSNTDVVIWLTSIAFISNPTPEMINEAQGLLDTKAPYRKAALAVSSLVHTYCLARPSCEEEAVVKAIMKVFETKLRYNCRAETSEDHDSILASLKAFGNLGFAGSSKTVIDRCISNEELPAELRAAAINSYRRMTCTVDRAEVMKIFSNARQDAELRINSYLSVISCADEEIIRRVKEVLESETVNQVGSFVWTHLTNLLETSSPLKQSIRDIVENLELKKQFDMDKRKFSRNIEWSLFSEMMNTGAAVESNLIWSEDSYIPRSTSLNLTVDVFGHSMNLLEVGARTQGLEKIIEQWTQPAQQNIIPSGPNQFDQQYNIPKDKTQASYYMRVFGNEIRYGDFHDFDPSTLKDKFNFLDFMIDLANDHNIDVTKNLMFLDASIAIPTTVGLPLTLSVDGSSSTNVKVNGKMDIRTLFARPSNLDISGSITPSAAIEIEGVMGVDAFVARTGLRMVTTLHTSTVLDGQVKMQEGKLLNIDLNMPRDRIELFSIESKFYMTYRGGDREQKMITDDKIEKSGCYTDLSTFLGVEFCGEVALPQAFKQETSPWFPFSGPAKAKIYINKVDTHTGYHFDMNYNQEKPKLKSGETVVKSNRLFTCTLDTPGSKINRRISADFAYKPAENSVRLAITNPWKKIEITGDGKYEDSIKRIATRVNIDDTNVWSLVSELKIEDSKKTGLSYMPNVEIIVAGKKPVTFKGLVAYKDGRRADVDVTLAYGGDSLMTCKGNVQKIIETGKNQGSVKYDVAMDVDVTKYIKTKITGFYKNGMEEVRTYSSRVFVEYSLEGRRAERITLNGKLRDRSQGNTIQYSADGSFVNTLYPKNDIDITVDVAKSPSSFSLNIDSGLDKTRRFKASALSSFILGAENKITAQVNFEVPSEKWQAGASLDHMHSSSQIKSAVSGKWRELEGSIEVNGRKAFNPLKLGADIKVKYPGREITASHSLDERNPSEYFNRLNIQYDKNAKIEINGVYKMKPRHEVSADITIPGVEKINVQAFLNPDVKNMQSRAELTVGKRKYATEVNWLVESAKFSGDAKFTLPIRTVTFATEMSRNGQIYLGSISTKWDADKDETKKAAIGGQITLSRQTPAIQLNAEWYPKQFVNFAINGKIESQNWQKTTTDIEGKMQMRTSFEKFEDISSNFVYDISPAGIKTGGEVVWAADKKISSDFEVKYNKDGSEVVVSAKTPFIGYKTLKVASSYKWLKNKLDTSFETSWETKKILFSSSATLDIKQHSFLGRMSLLTPFSGFEQTEINVKHKDNGSIFNSNIDVLWSKGQKASAAFKMDHQLTGSTFANKGEVSLTGPFRIFKSAKTLWDTQILSGNVRIHGEMEADKQRGVIDFQGSDEIAATIRKMNIRGSLTSPISNLESISISHFVESDIKNLNYLKSDTSVQWAAGRAITITREFNMNLGSSIRYKMAVTTPFRNYEKFAADLNTEISGSTYKMRHELSKGDQKLGFEGAMSINGYEFQGNARFTSPFKPVTAIVANVKNVKTGNTWKSNYDLEYIPGKKIEMDTEVNVVDNKKIGFSLKTPFAQAQRVAGSVSFMGNARNFDASVEADHNLLEKKITGSLKVDVSTLPTIKVNLNIVTPFRAISFIRQSFSHRLSGKTNYITEGKFEIPQYAFSSMHELNLRSAKNFNTKGNYELKSGTTSQKFEVTTQFQWTNSLTFRSTLKTPFQGYEEMSANFAQDGTLKNWRVNAEAVKGSDKITLNTEYIMNENGIRGTMRLTTPFRSVEKVEATFVHSGVLPVMKNTASLLINDKIFSMENEFSIQTGNVKLSSRIDTPFNGYETMSLNVEHKGTPLDFKTSVTAQYPSNVYSAGVEFSLVGTVTKGKVTIATPVPSFNSFTAEFNTDAKKWNDFTNTWAVEIFGQRSFGSSELKWTGKTKTASIYTNIPEKYGAKVTYTGELTNFNMVTKVEYAGKEIIETKKFKMTDSKIEGSYRLQTPYTGYENFEAALMHTGSAKQFRSEVTAKTSIAGYDSFRSEITHSNDNDLSNIRTSVKIETPISKWRTLSATFTHAGQPTDFACALTLERNLQQKIEKTIKFKKTSNGFDVSAVVTTPFSGYERFEKSIKYISAINKKSVSINVQTPFGNYNRFKADSSYELGSDTFLHSTRIETSVPGYDSFAYTFGIAPSTTPVGGMTVHANVRTPFNNFKSTSFESTHAIGAKVQQFSVKVDTSVPKFNSFSASLNHEYIEPKDKTRGCSMKLEVHTPIQGFESTSYEYAWSRDVRTKKIQFTSKLDTSYPGYDIFSTSFSLSPDPSALVTRLEISTPFERYNRFVAEINTKVENTKYSYNSRIETSIPNFETFSSSASFEGNWNTFTIKSEVNTPITPYNRFATSLSHKTTKTNIETSAQIETTVPKWQRFGIRMVHNMAKGIKNTITIDTPISGFEKITTDFDHKGFDARMITTRCTINTGSKQFSANFNLKGENTGVKSNIELTSNIPGYDSFTGEYSHEGEPRNFRASLKIRTPFEQFPSISTEISHKRLPSNIESFAAIEYGSQKRYEGKIVLTIPNSKTFEGEYETTFSLKSPHSSFQEFIVSGKHSMKPVLRDGEFFVSYNGDRKFAFNYDYTEGPDYKIRMSFTDPQPMEYSVSFAKGQETLNAEVSANWNTQRSDSNVKVSLELTNQVESSQTTRKVSIGLTTPSREAALSTSYILSNSRFTTKMDLQWEAGKKFSYDFDSSKTIKRGQVVYDGKLSLNSQIEITGSHKIIGNRQHVTEVGLKGSNRLIIKSDLTLLKSSSFKHTLTLVHPRFTKDVVISTESSIESGKTIDGKISIKYEDQAIDFSGRAADESTRSDLKYTVLCKLTHPNSNTDVQFQGEIKNNQKIVGANTEIKWMMSDRSIKTLTSRVEFDRLQNEATSEIVTPMGTWGVTGRQTYGNHDEGIYRYIISLTCCSKTFKTEAELNRPERSIETKFYYTADNFLHVYAKYMSPYHMQFEIYRQHNGEKINDILMALKLKEENILNGRMFIRPDLSSDLQALTAESTYATSVQRTYGEISDAVNQEMMSKVGAWKKSAEPIVRAINVVGSELNVYTTQIIAVYKRMYSRNDFFIRDVVDSITEQVNILSRIVNEKINNMRTRWTKWNREMQYNMKSYMVTMSQLSANIRKELDSALDVIENGVRKAVETIAKYWPYYTNIKERLTDLNRIVKDKIAELKERIKSHPSIEPYLSRLPSESPAGYVDALREAAIDYVKSQMPEGTTDYAKDIWNNVGRRSEIRALLNSVKQYSSKVKYFYDYYEIDTATYTLLSDLYSHGWEMMKSQALDFVDNYLRLDRTRWTVWDPKTGQYEFELWIPIKLPNLQRLPELPNFSQYVARLTGLVQKLWPENDWIFWDTWYSYKPSSDYMNIIPPFKTRAALVGNQHFMTFDRKFYEYAGECSYLLARDFINGKFSVSVNYERTTDGSSKKSITVATSGRQIMIFPTGKVSVDGKRSELPLQMDSTTVTRYGNVVRLDNTNGLTITCDLAHDRCTLNVTGWYYGKTGGMFGTYDNEPNNDMTMPSNQIAEDTESFADSWTVGQKCRKVNYAVVAPESIDNRRTALCAKYFKDQTSEFRNCFKIVSPDPFMTMCLNDIPTNINRVETDEDVCNITAFYIDECRREGVPLRMPKVCVRCDMDSGRSFFEGDSVTLSETTNNLPRAADVVFMIQHAACNKASVEKLKSFVDEMEKAFKIRGIDSIRYAIVGYGGMETLAQAHIHTIDGQIFNSREMFNLGVESFSSHTNSDKADGLFALRFALRMPFRSGVSKNVVLIPCSSCSEQSISYAEIQQVLFETDIRLHVMLGHNFEIKGKTPKSVSYYGADKDALYSRKDAGKKDVTGDSELRNQIGMPKDLCAALAEETNGSVFSSQQLVNRRPDEIKAFLDVFAHVVARKGEPTKCQRCECVVDEVGVGRSMCRSCEDRMPIYTYLPNFTEETSDTDNTKIAVDPVVVPETTTKPSVQPPKPVPEKPVQPQKPQPIKPATKPVVEKPQIPAKPTQRPAKGNKPVDKPAVKPPKSKTAKI